MLNLMVLHWGTSMTQTINIDCNAPRGKFATRSGRGSFCAGQDFDTIPVYKYDVPQIAQVLN